MYNCGLNDDYVLEADLETESQTLGISEHQDS